MLRPRFIPFLASSDPNSAPRRGNAPTPPTLTPTLPVFVDSPQCCAAARPHALLRRRTTVRLRRRLPAFAAPVAVVSVDVGRCEASIGPAGGAMTDFRACCRSRQAILPLAKRLRSHVLDRETEAVGPKASTTDIGGRLCSTRPRSRRPDRSVLVAGSHDRSRGAGPQILLSADDQWFPTTARL